MFEKKKEELDIRFYHPEKGRTFESLIGDIVQNRRDFETVKKELLEFFKIRRKWFEAITETNRFAVRDIDGTGLLVFHNVHKEMNGDSCVEINLNGHTAGEFYELVMANLLERLEMYSKNKNNYGELLEKFRSG